MADEDDKSASTPKDDAEPTDREGESATGKIGSFMERALEVSERLLREHKERENNKPKSKK